MHKSNYHNRSNCFGKNEKKKKKKNEKRKEKEIEKSVLELKIRG